MHWFLVKYLAKARYEIIYCVNCEIENWRFLWNKINPFITRRKRISYCEAIFHARSVFHKSARIYFIEKRLFRRIVFFLEEPNGLDAVIFTPKYTSVNNLRYFFDCLFASVFKPLCYNCGYSVKIKHHSIFPVSGRIIVSF